MRDAVSLGFQAVAAALLGCTHRAEQSAPPTPLEQDQADERPFHAGGSIPAATTPEERLPTGTPRFHRNEAGILGRLAVLIARPGGTPLAAAQALFSDPANAWPRLVADLRVALENGAALQERHTQMLLSLLDATGELPGVAERLEPDNAVRAAGVRDAIGHLVERLRQACGE